MNLCPGVRLYQIDLCMQLAAYLIYILTNQKVDCDNFLFIYIV